MKFNWDEKKNKANIRKHKISFESSAYVFADIEALTIYDDEHSNFEERWITIGQIKNIGIVVVVHTSKMNNNKELIRIISARKANKNEIKEYYNSIEGKTP